MSQIILQSQFQHWILLSLLTSTRVYQTLTALINSYHNDNRFQSRHYASILIKYALIFQPRHGSIIIFNLICILRCRFQIHSCSLGTHASILIFALISQLRHGSITIFNIICIPRCRFQTIFVVFSQHSCLNLNKICFSLLDMAV